MAGVETRPLTAALLVTSRICPLRFWRETQPQAAGLAGDSKQTERWHAAPAATGPLSIQRGAAAVAAILAEGARHEDCVSRDACSEVERQAEVLARRLRHPWAASVWQVQDLSVLVDRLMPSLDAAGQVQGYVLQRATAALSASLSMLEHLAIQAWVLAECGVSVLRVEAVHLRKGVIWQPGLPRTALLGFQDVTRQVQVLARRVPSWLATARSVRDGAAPKVKMGGYCRKPTPCSWLSTCLAESAVPEPGNAVSGLGEDLPTKPVPRYPVEDLPTPKGKRLATQLRAEGFDDLRQVPAERLQGTLFQRYAQAARTGEPYIAEELIKACRTWPWPRWYLDFETVGFALPIWPGCAPHEMVPFQFSLHLERTASPDALEHREFLDLSGQDPRRACAEALLRLIDDAGPIFVYNANFESSVLGRLARDFPELSPGLLALQKRLVDLEPLMRQGYYHRDQHGSYSLKAVLPTIAPDLEYSALGAVQDGLQAQLAYVEAIAPTTSEARRTTLHDALARYCALDTYGLVRLNRQFADLSAGSDALPSSP